MSDITLHAELMAQGVSHPELARLVRQGELTRLRRGAYAPAASNADPADAHRALLTATLRQVSEQAVASHASAAVLHGLPTWPDQLTCVHVTRDRAGGGRLDRDLRIHGTPLDPSEIVVLGTDRVTSLARTAVDLARTETLERGVSVFDAALRRRIDPALLRAAVLAAKGRHGIARARTALDLGDDASESPGESFSRVRFWRWGLPEPVLQLEILDHRGREVARCDFGWPELGTVGEFDGDVKYGALLKPGQSLQDVILKEKRREERIRELGWQVVRWTWSDLSDRAGLMGRLEAAFRRGRPLAA